MTPINANQYYIIRNNELQVFEKPQWQTRLMQAWEFAKVIHFVHSDNELKASLAPPLLQRAVKFSYSLDQNSWPITKLVVSLFLYVLSYDISKMLTEIKTYSRTDTIIDSEQNIVQYLNGSSLKEELTQKLRGYYIRGAFDLRILRPLIESAQVPLPLMVAYANERGYNLELVRTSGNRAKLSFEAIGRIEDHNPGVTMYSKTAVIIRSVWAEIELPDGYDAPLESRTLT